MSWTYTTKLLVSNTAKVPQTDLQDQWCDWVEALIDDWVGTTYTGTTTYTDEMHSGDDTSTLFIDHPPIVSVSALTVDGGNFVLPAYKTFSHYIELVPSGLSQVSNALYVDNVFPRGVGNILVSYVGGSSVVPKKVELAATLMVSAIATYNAREGAEASLKWSRVTTTDGMNSTTTETSGLPTVLEGIMKKFLPRKVLFL